MRGTPLSLGRFAVLYTAQLGLHQPVKVPLGVNERRAKAYCQKGTRVLSLITIILLVKVPLGVNERRAQAYCQRGTRVLSLQCIMQLVKVPLGHLV